MLLVLVAACNPVTDTADTAEEAAEAPTLAWIAPQDGDDVSPDVNGSVAAEDFTFVDLAKHSEGGAAGYLEVSVDGVVIDAYDTTTFTLSGLEAGARVLSAALVYDDGDAVLAKDGRLCEEDASDCTAVAAAITVNVVAGG